MLRLNCLVGDVQLVAALRLSHAFELVVCLERRRNVAYCACDLECANDKSGVGESGEVAAERVSPDPERMKKLRSV
jgi:hypothetical protein